MANVGFMFVFRAMSTLSVRRDRGRRRVSLAKISEQEYVCCFRSLFIAGSNGVWRVTGIAFPGPSLSLVNTGTMAKNAKSKTASDPLSGGVSNFLIVKFPDAVGSCSFGFRSV